MKLSFDDEETFKEAAESLRFSNLPNYTDTLALQRVGSSSTGSMPALQERNEDICFINPPSDPNTTIQQLGVGSSSLSSTPSRERIEVT